VKLTEVKRLRSDNTLEQYWINKEFIVTVHEKLVDGFKYMEIAFHNNTTMVVENSSNIWR
jgi:hypothetical protein